MKIRLFALARDLGIDASILVELCAEAGVKLRNALAAISEEERDIVVAYIRQKSSDLPARAITREVKPQSERELYPEVGTRPAVAHIRAVIAEMGTSSNVYTISLAGLQLTTLPSELYQLIELRHLDISRNAIQVFPGDLQRLQQLQTLRMDNNRLTDVSSIPTLAKLSDLNLRNNDISTLPASIFRLPSLQNLNLSDNKIESLPESVQSATHLTTLDVRGNLLSTLPYQLTKLERLSRLLLHRNPRLPIPIEITGTEEDPRQAIDVLNYFFPPLSSREKKKILEAKLILVGQGTSGKTSIVNRLLNLGFDPDEQQTDGIAVTTHTWPVPPPDAPATGEVPKHFSKKRLQKKYDAAHPFRSVRVNIWDFGGQEILHSTHQFFLTQRSVYLLVVNARAGEHEGNIHYWLRTIQTFGIDAPVIIVINKSEPPHYIELDQNRLTFDYAPNIVGFVNVSCKTGSGIPELKARIQGVLQQMQHIYDEMPLPYFEVKSELENQRRILDFVSNSEFEKICVKHGVHDGDSQRVLLRFLHELGTILCYDDADQQYQLYDTNVLNPEWVTSGVYRIITNHDLLMRRDGRVTWKAVLRCYAGDPRYPADKIRFLLELMRKFDLCFPLDMERGEFLVPELLGVNEPILPVPTLAAIRFQIRYELLPRGLMPRFIVRTHHLHSNPPMYWRSGVILEIEGCRVSVRGDVRKGVVHIDVDGQEPVARRRALAIVRDHFRAVHGAYGFMSPREMVPLPFEPDSEPVEFDFLAQLERKGVVMHDFPRCKSAVNIRDLLNGIDDNRFDVFLSFNGQDRVLVREVRRVLLQHGIRAYLDEEEVEPGTHWATRIPEMLAKSNCIAIFIGRGSISGWAKEEYAMALDESVTCGKKLIPVRLPGAVPIDQLPASYGFLRQRQAVDLSDGVSEATVGRLVKVVNSLR